MPKTYPMYIENIGDDEYQLMSRGHHDVHNFMGKVRADGYNWPLGMPRHTWFRVMPVDGGESSAYIEATAGGRGAFPVTCVTEGYGEEAYEAILKSESALVAMLR